MGALGVLRGLIGLEPFTQPVAPQGEEGHGGSLLGSQQEALSHTIAEAVPVRVVPNAGSSRGGSEGREGSTGVVVEEYNEVLPPRLEEDLRRLERAARYGGNDGAFASSSSYGEEGEDSASGQRNLHRPIQGKSLLFGE